MTFLSVLLFTLFLTMIESLFYQFLAHHNHHHLTKQLLKSWVARGHVEAGCVEPRRFFMGAPIEIFLLGGRERITIVGVNQHIFIIFQNVKENKKESTPQWHRALGSP